MPASRATAEPPPRILVVDDDPETVRMVRSFLKAPAYDILEAANGEEGLERALAEKPDLVLLDLNMPVLDGFDMANRLRAAPDTTGIPILILSARRDSGDKVRAFACGADDYVTKPFDVEEVEARIGVLLRKRGMYEALESRASAAEVTNQQLEELLVVDEKTGLLNFRGLQKRLRDEWARAERYQMTLSLVMLDLDDFKRLNDTYGHPAGDRILREFATLVAGGARVTDVAARYGGEEFAIVLPHTDGAMARRVADRIRAAVAEFRFLEDEGPVRLTVSAGLATFPSNPRLHSAEDLLRAADQALYRAKRAGKNRVAADGDE